MAIGNKRRAVQRMKEFEILWSIGFILGLLLKLISVYFGGVACFAWKKPTEYPKAERQRKFAVLAAARNEEAVIGGLVESLQKQDYPKECYDIFVIPNHCTDDTEGAALRSGAQIIRCSGKVGCKGDALHQAIEQLLREDYEAFCVFDADNFVAPDFLTRMNEAFDAGAKVAKGKQVAKNPYDHWVSGCYGIYFELFHLFFNRSRAACGLSAKLVGTGFAVHREVLERLGGWHTVTLAEDAEFSSFCAELGERVWWVQDAVTYDEQPVSFLVSLRQRRRWCSGIMQVAKLRLPALLQRMKDGNGARWLLLDFILFLLAPFAQALSVVPLGLCLLSAVMEGTSAGLSLLWGIPAYWCGMMVMAAGLVWMQNGKRMDWQMGKSILLFPLFMASWIPLQIISLCRETKKWEEIRHTGGVALEGA